MRPTLNVNLTLSVIPCKTKLDIIDFYVVNCHLLFDFSFKLQSSMTVVHYKDVRMQNISKMNELEIN
jgi:hypothetical protein